MWATVALEGGLKQKVCAPPHPDSKWLLTFSFLCFLEAIRQSWCVSALLFQSRFNSAWFAEGMNLLRWPQTSLLMKRNMLLWETLLLCDCFCFSGSNVSWNQLGMRVYLAMLRSCVFRATAGKTSPLVQTPGVKIIEREMLFMTVWRTVVVSWTCDFAGPFVWLSGPLRLKVFPPVGFQHTWCFGTHEILKKVVRDLTIESGQTFTRNQEKSRSGPPWLQ